MPLACKHKTPPLRLFGLLRRGFQLVGPTGIEPMTSTV